jgi:hypothetical protein
VTRGQVRHVERLTRICRDLPSECQKLLDREFEAS